jgi:hypothetical protein
VLAPVIIEIRQKHAAIRHGQMDVAIDRAGLRNGHVPRNPDVSDSTNASPVRPERRAGRLGGRGNPA